MQEIKIDLKKFGRKEVRIVAEEIKKGKVVVLPTDTVYGLSAICTNPKSLNKINQIKQRTAIKKREKHFILLVKSFCMIRRYCYLNKKQYDFLKKEWTKNRSLSVILKKRSEVVLSNKTIYKIGDTISNNDGVAVRLPQNNFLIQLIKAMDEPIVSTSLNITGEKPLENVTIDKLKKYFKNYQPDIFINAGKLAKQKPSKLVDIRNMKAIKILRR